MIRSCLAQPPPGTTLGGLQPEAEESNCASRAGSDSCKPPDLRRVASAAGRLSAAEMSRISRAYEDADSETKDVNAGEYLFLGE
ncbi:hypothetical protein Pmar_PMAR014224 [Perkinsus marinus ATCC 50983]|uniref:Uncharacterized protein n=1 Tax=Perkinsus marinus (strain ATCC 50983 / TXsc) TaxID=423536 RepID=C5LX32_PERM5|nr:hypothetical protein Pmar_PMAR014224 [Perkinsus marinus ATCC 50983]EEQ98711.1 hypothetical protein Pmar_PMAR014224 [Perkinsus marinus ATCC 50983]|eukprot:XP_002765994.1 hypothetical protein Pmar_PMAR014224 [Perkinsus marinus ATCC 50983]